MNPLEQKLKDNPTAAQLALDLVARGKRPPGWSKRSNSSYYNKRNAEELKVALDEMLNGKEAMVFPLNDGKTRTMNSVYLRINQAFRYLMDFLDPHNTYKELNNRIKIVRLPGEGVKLRFIDGTDDIGLPSAKYARQPISRQSWKDAVDSYLENAEPGEEPLVIENIVLLPSQIQDLKDSLAGVTGIIFNIRAHSIKIVRLPSHDNPPAT